MRGIVGVYPKHVQLMCRRRTTAGQYNCRLDLHVQKEQRAVQHDLLLNGYLKELGSAADTLRLPRRVHQIPEHRAYIFDVIAHKGLGVD